jgi:hypothetical protein
MSQLFYNWFKICYENTPPTVTQGQLLQALERGMLTEAEYQDIIGEPQPQPEPDPEATPEEPPTEEPPTEEPPTEEPPIEETPPA